MVWNQCYEESIETFSEQFYGEVKDWFDISYTTVLRIVQEI